MFIHSVLRVSLFLSCNVKKHRQTDRQTDRQHGIHKGLLFSVSGRTDSKRGRATKRNRWNICKEPLTTKSLGYPTNTDPRVQ